MKFEDKLQIAFQNLTAGKKMVRKIIFGMSFVVMILLCSAMIVKSYFDFINLYNEKHIKDCYYYSVIESLKITDENINKVLGDARLKQQEYHADEISFMFTVELDDTEVCMNAENTNLIINGAKYQAVNYYANQRKVFQNIYGANSPISLALYEDGLNVFPEKIVEEYGNDYLLGNYPVNEGEIILDTYILGVYGVENVDESLLGSNVCICCLNEDNEEIILHNYTLTGIFKGDILSDRESITTNEIHLEHIYVNLYSEDEDKFIIKDGSIRYYFHNYNDYIQNYDQKDNILQLKLTELYSSDEVLVKLTGKGIESCLLYWIMDKIGKTLLLIAIVIVLIITLSVLYIFQFYRNRNARYLAMLQNIGMKKKDRISIFSIEVCTMIIAAILLGIYMSAIFLILLNAVTKQTLNFELFIS